jgi:hypothetical protein
LQRQLESKGYQNAAPAQWWVCTVPRCA